MKTTILNSISQRFPSKGQTKAGSIIHQYQFIHSKLSFTLDNTFPLKYFLPQYTQLQQSLPTLHLLSNIIQFHTIS